MLNLGVLGWGMQSLARGTEKNDQSDTDDEIVRHPSAVYAPIKRISFDYHVLDLFGKYLDKP